MKVIHDHDGGVDDLVALALLAASPEVELVGVVVTPGSTELEAAVLTTRALLDLAGQANVPVAAGSLAGTNPFPESFRVDGAEVGARTVLAGVDQRSIRSPRSDDDGHVFVADLLLAQDEPVVVVATGPLTTLAAAMDEHPDVEDHIERLYWMGGAIDADGNVQEPDHDGNAEWNAYCDPAAAARVWDSNVDIRLCPLDATNAVPLTQELVDRLAGCGGSPLASFAAQAYGPLDHSVYWLWDVLTALWLLQPDVLFSEVVPCEVVTESPSEGQTRRVMAGRAVTAALDADGPGAVDALVTRLCAWRLGG